MLLRFGVTNHRSLRERQELSLVASSLDGSEDGLIECRHAPGGRLVPAAVIYGANASGKSNLVRALQWMRTAVLESHRGSTAGEVVPRRPFALDAASASMPSAFDIDFVSGGVRYNYGFETSDTAILTEWLLAFPKNHRQVLFERKSKDISFGRNLKGRNHVIADLTRPNSLFLSAAAQNGHDELARISQFFRTITVPRPALDGIRPIEKGASLDDRALHLLKMAGTGVIGHRIMDMQSDAVVGPLMSKFGTFIAQERGIPADLMEAALRDMGRIELAHQGADGQSVFLKYSEESEGTRRLVDLLPAVYRALDVGSVLVVDELDASLHTRACELLLALFSSHVTNPKGAQMIATTHDTNLLHSSLLRRDQIWLTEKDHEGATHLYPLTDIRTRKTDNIARGYLQGRCGAIPFAGNVGDLLATL